MQQINFLVTALAGIIIPTVVGMIWYNPKVMGTAWMKEAGLTPEDAKGVNMAKAMVFSIIASFFIALFMNIVVIHQFAINSIFASPADMEAYKDTGSELHKYIDDFYSKYGRNFRTFKHGAFHGFLTALLFVTPVMAHGAIWERKSFKYLAINAGYWIITLTLVGGVICAYS